MNVAESAGLVEGLDIYERVHAQVDDRTREILEHRRRTGVVRRRGWLVRRLLATADVVGILAAILLAEAVVTAASHADALSARGEVVALTATLPAWVVIAKLYGLYDRDEERADHSTADEFAAVFHVVTVSTWLFWVSARLSGVVHPTAPKLLIFWAAAISFVCCGRSTARLIARRNVSYLQNTVVVGAGDVGQMIARKLLQHPEYGLNVVGLVDSHPTERWPELKHLALLGDPSKLPTLVRLLDVERIIVAFSNEPHEATLELIHQLKEFDLQVDIVPRLFEAIGPNLGVHMVEGLPLVGLPPLRLSRSSALLKRAVDIGVSLIALALVSPLLVALALAIKLDSRGPVLYRHARVGRGRSRIDVLKFRTMKLEACRGERYGGAAAEAMFHDLMSDPGRAREFEEMYKLASDPRVTRVGAFLRKTSLDELPQLINVLRGELSLVGPRAITEDELARYGEHVDDLLAFRPGVTGYWQINGRSRLNYQDRVRLDLSYIAGWSLALDLTILAKTAGVLVAQRDAC
jgi:exopolysaccharide biosynthesis polyprenyl glycosylphosphotransferase